MPVLKSSRMARFSCPISRCPYFRTRPLGGVKQAFGWQVERIAVAAEDGSPGVGAQVMFRRLPLGLSLAYIPRGPVGLEQYSPTNRTWSQWIAEVDQLCLARNAVFLKVEPDFWEMDTTAGELSQYNAATPPLGFRFSQTGCPTFPDFIGQFMRR